MEQEPETVLSQNTRKDLVTVIILDDWHNDDQRRRCVYNFFFTTDFKDCLLTISYPHLPQSQQICLVLRQNNTRITAKPDLGPKIKPWVFIAPIVAAVLQFLR